MKLQLVPASTGFQWVMLALQTFRSQPMALTSLFVIAVVAMSTLSVLPLIGPVVALALLPVTTLTMMVAAAEASRGRRPTLGLLLVAFRSGPQRLQSMLTLGAMYAAGFLLILVFRHNLTVAAIIASFVVLELGVGASQTISNDTIVASVPAAKAGAASAVSETAYELGAVVGTATLGTIFSAFYRANVELPQGLTPAQAGDSAESIGGAVAVARDLPAAKGDVLLESARAAFDSGVAPTAIIATTLTLAAAVIVARTFGRQR